MVGSKIIKLLYEYPIGIENSDSFDGGNHKRETLNTMISVSSLATNGYFNLNVSKIFQYEEGRDDDFGNEENSKILHKTKKESQVLKYNGEIYPFDPKDRLRFL